MDGCHGFPVYWHWTWHTKNKPAKEGTFLWAPILINQSIQTHKKQVRSLRLVWTHSFVGFFCLTCFSLSRGCTCGFIPSPYSAITVILLTLQIVVFFPRLNKFDNTLKGNWKWQCYDFSQTLSGFRTRGKDMILLLYKFILPKIIVLIGVNGIIILWLIII